MVSKILFSASPCAAAIVVFAVTVPVGASAVTFEFAGVIDIVDDPNGHLGGMIQAGDNFSGTYTFDSEAPDLTPADPAGGNYRPSPSALAISVGGFEVATAEDTLTRVGIGNLDDLDTFVIDATNFDSAGFHISQARLLLMDPTGSALDSDALPLLPPELSLFQTREFRVTGHVDNPDLPFDLYGTVTALTTPEPGAAVLLLAGTVLIRRQR